MSALKINPPVGRLPTIEWVPIGDLLIDDSYQRSIETKASRALIAAIAADWNWDLLDVLKVSRRPDDRLFVVDGQHRKAGGAMRGDIQQLPCVIKRCAGPAEEARLFIQANRGRKAMSRLDDFRAAVGAGDAEAVAIERMVEAAGLKIARQDVSRGGNAPGELPNVGAMRQALRKRGEKVTGQAISLIGEAFPDETIVAPTPLFQAIVELLAIDRLDREQLFETLLVGTNEQWCGWAQLKTITGGQSRVIALRSAIMARYRTMAVAA